MAEANMPRHVRDALEDAIPNWTPDPPLGMRVRQRVRRRRRRQFAGIAVGMAALTAVGVTLSLVHFTPTSESQVATAPNAKQALPRCPELVPRPQTVDANLRASTTLLCVYGTRDQLVGRGAVINGDPLRAPLLRIGPLAAARTCNANFDALSAVIRIDQTTKNSIVVNLSGCAAVLLPHGERAFFTEADDVNVTSMFAKARRRDS